MPHKPQGRKPSAAPRPPESPASGLKEVDRLIQQRKLIEARHVLESLHRRYPDQPAILRKLADLHYRLKDLGPYQRACESLLALTPDDANLQIELGDAYLINGRPALALRIFQRFLEQHPRSPRAAEVRANIGKLEAVIDELLDQSGLTGPAALEFAELHEALQGALSRGEFAAVPAFAEQLLARKPDFAPALNNLSQSYLLTDQVDLAIATAQRVLAFEPANVHALANLVYFHCRIGQPDRAHEYAVRLRQSDQPAADKWLKVAEALSFLGDDEGVLATFERAQQDPAPRGAEMALLYHLAAVAELRQGREHAALRLWQQALKLNPGLEIARANLADMRKPIGQRHAPWPYDFAHWVSSTTIAQIAEAVGTHRGNEVPTRAIRTFLAQRPDIAALAPILLDRGDPTARQFALMLAETAATPELHAALYDFARSQRGPDSMRNQAAGLADGADLIPDRKIRMWIDGKWSDLELMGFEISGEPTSSFGPQVEPLALRATEALHARQGAKAEQLLKQALALEPESPALLNNLALAYEQQGRREAAEALTREIHARFPDYIFAGVALARLHLRDGDPAAAEELLAPLFKRRRLHYAEAAMLFSTRIDVDIALDKHDAARTWLDMWAGIDPDNPAITRYRQLLGGVAKPARRR